MNVEFRTMLVHRAPQPFWVDVNHGFVCRFIASSSDIRIGKAELDGPVESATVLLTKRLPAPGCPC
jgi:hypothetical protein